MRVSNNKALMAAASAVFLAAACSEDAQQAEAPQQAAPAQQVAPVQQAAPAQEESTGFVSLFDGSTLTGWRGEESIWSVRDGAITGGSNEPLTINTFLVYEQPFSNFELRYRYRLEGDGNSGVQFRSVVSDEATFAVQGYQANVVPVEQAERFGMLWEEGGRGELALLGHRMVIDRVNGEVVETVPESVNPRELLYSITRPYPEWNDVVVIAYDNHIVHALNGYLLFDATDNDPAASKDGVLAIQAHSGPPMFVQFNEVKLKKLESPPDLDGRFVSNPGPATPADPGPRVARKQ